MEKISLDVQIARKCKETRIKRNITKKEFAEFCGVPKKFVDEYEKGVRVIPTEILLVYLNLKYKGEKNE